MNIFQAIGNFFKSRFNRTPQIEAPKYNTGRLGGLPVEKKDKEGVGMEDLKPQTDSEIFRAEVSKSADKFNWAEMSRDEAITTMLIRLGMKPELANNEDARREILAIVNKTIGDAEISDSTQVSLKNLICDDGTIAFDEDFLLNGKSQKFYEVAKGTREVLSSISSTIIDVNKEGQLVKNTKSVQSEQSNYYDGRIEKSYSKKDTRVVIDHGVEMQRTENYSDTKKLREAKEYSEHSESSTKTVTLNRDPNLLSRAYGEMEVTGNFSQDYGYVYLNNIDAYGETLGSHANLANLSIKEIRAGKELSGFGYNGNDNNKMQQQKATYEKEQQRLIDENPNFRKLAEKLGIVKSKEETGIEQTS